MAEGLLLVLAGEECKQKERYTGLSKSYDFEFLLGFATDTYDLLGKVTEIGVANRNLSEEVKNYFAKLLGTHTEEYPPYSSKTVNGKQLFTYAREGTLGDIEIPTHEVTISDIELKNIREICGAELLKSIEEKISKISGDFRQSEILELWREKITPDQKYFLVSASVSGESGMYVRKIVHDLGITIGVPAVTYLILRTRVGEWTLDDTQFS